MYSIIYIGIFVIIFNNLTALIYSDCLSSSFRDINSPIPPVRITKPQPPYGCSQMNPLTAKDAFRCFSAADVTRRRSSRHSMLNPDVGVSVDKLIQNHGYPVEIHNVTTKDGYILTLFRIPHGKNSNVSTKGPVLLQHGLLASSAQWLLNVPDRKSLGFLLADKGYDVFLGNCRGSKYSQSHVKLDPKSDEVYWDFSWHEIGMFDLPATIDYILKETGKEQLVYIGHSMGTTMLFTALSMDPSYNEKIKMAFLLSPIAYLANSTNIAHFTALIGYYSQPLLSGLINGPVPSNTLNQFFNNRIFPICESTAVTCTLCSNLMFSFFGFDYEQMNFNQLPIFLSHFPDQGSTKSMIHFIQSMLTGDFRQFDYGPTKNPEIYNGSCKPPKYDLSKVKVPTIIFWSWNDNFATPNDVKKTASDLPNLKASIEIPHCAFNHIDYAIAKDADTFIYKKILKFMSV